jgi:hypothetical protein
MDFNGRNAVATSHFLGFGTDLTEPYLREVETKRFVLVNRHLFFASSRMNKRVETLKISNKNCIIPPFTPSGCYLVVKPLTSPEIMLAKWGIFSVCLFK